MLLDAGVAIMEVSVGREVGAIQCRCQSVLATDTTTDTRLIRDVAL
jgi:hypothetical protein